MGKAFICSRAMDTNVKKFFDCKDFLRLERKFVLIFSKMDDISEFRFIKKFLSVGSLHEIIRLSAIPNSSEII